MSPSGILSSRPDRLCWKEGSRLEPHTHDAWSFWSAAQPKDGDTEARLQMRLAACDALHLAPRDPRFWKPSSPYDWPSTPTG